MVILFRQLREISGPIAEEILVVLRYQVDTETTLGIHHANKERAYEGHTGFMTHEAICGGVYLLLSNMCTQIRFLCYRFSSYFRYS